MSERHILVIDDDTDIAEIVCAVAAGCRISCLSAGNLASIVAALTPEPDLILMDLSMPEISGLEVMAQLAARGCRSRLVLMSGAGSVVLREAEAFGRSLGLPMLPSLGKPFRGAELRALLVS
jgi:CheY-like chemotaxis protein